MRDCTTVTSLIINTLRFEVVCVLQKWVGQGTDYSSDT